MTPELSPNTQAILLLTAPLLAGRNQPDVKPLTPSEYNKLAKQLWKMHREPADLLGLDAGGLVRTCRAIVAEDRLQGLLGRGLLLSQAFERWRARAIWVVSRADETYPSRFKARLGEHAPAVVYGCGDRTILESGGLAVVGSRKVSPSLEFYAARAGHLAAAAGKTIISGGAAGVDSAAMAGALEAGGRAVGVLGDSLGKAVLKRDYRNMLLQGRLVLVSSSDPSVGFAGWRAMQRNKFIYALSDASLVVRSDLKGGTWEGAVEQLGKLKFVPVYVRTEGEPYPAREALLRKGATPWPEPRTAEDLAALLAPVPITSVRSPVALDLFAPSRGAPAEGSTEGASAPDSDGESVRERSAKEALVAPDVPMVSENGGTLEAGATPRPAAEPEPPALPQTTSSETTASPEATTSSEAAVPPAATLAPKSPSEPEGNAAPDPTVSRETTRSPEVASVGEATSAAETLPALEEGRAPRAGREPGAAGVPDATAESEATQNPIPAVVGGQAESDRVEPTSRVPTPAERLFDLARGLICQELEKPMKDAEVAAVLGLEATQAKAWLKRLVEDGVVEKRKRPVAYVVKGDLFVPRSGKERP